MANSGNSSTRYGPNRDKRSIAVDVQDGATVSVTLEDTEKTFRQEMLASLSHICTLLQVILNHQRSMSGIESENEGDF